MHPKPQGWNMFDFIESLLDGIQFDDYITSLLDATHWLNHLGFYKIYYWKNRLHPISGFDVTWYFLNLKTHCQETFFQTGACKMHSNWTLGFWLHKKSSVRPHNSPRLRSLGLWSKDWLKIVVSWWFLTNPFATKNIYICTSNGGFIFFPNLFGVKINISLELAQPR